VKRLYLSDDFLDTIEPWLFGRELWFGIGSHRPLKADSVEEFKKVVNGLHLHDSFPFFMSVESFSDPTLLEREDPNHIRVSWDFFLDLDCDEEFDAARKAAYKAKQVLEKFNIENYILKFSGRRGFHLLIPGLSLDIFQPGEFRLAYPKLAVMLARFFEAVIYEPKVKVDLSVYKPRQLMRAPYSWHEKTGLLSIPLDDPLKFKLEDAKPENTKIHSLYIKGDVGEARKLLEAVRDWIEDQGEEEPGLKILSYGKIKQDARGYGWVERLLEHPVDDGRHRILWLIVAPYLVNIKGLSVEDAKKEALDYLQKCSKIKPIEGDLGRLADYYVNYASRVGLKPVSLQTLTREPQYRDLYEILKPIIQPQGLTYLRIKAKVPKIFKKESLEKEEAEYEVEPALIAEAKAIVESVLNTFRKYPRSKHWAEKEEWNLMLGWLAEIVFDMTLNQLRVPHIWLHPLIQNEKVRRREATEPDFIINGKTVEVKASTKEKQPKYFHVNKDRWLDHKSDYVVFFWFSPDLKHAWISGWIEGEKIEGFPVKKLRYSPAFEIPRTDLKPIKSLFELLKNEKEVKK